MPDGATCEVPPGSSPLRELAHVIDQALALPKNAAERDVMVLVVRLRRDTGPMPGGWH
jgi:hypothetical protein